MATRETFELVNGGARMVLPLKIQNVATVNLTIANSPTRCPRLNLQSVRLWRTGASGASGPATVQRSTLVGSVDNVAVLEGLLVRMMAVKTPLQCARKLDYVVPNRPL